MVRDLTREDLAELAALYEHFWNEKSDLQKMNDMFTKLDDDPPIFIYVVPTTTAG